MCLHDPPEASIPSNLLIIDSRGVLPYLQDAVPAASQESGVSSSSRSSHPLSNATIRDVLRLPVWRQLRSKRFWSRDKPNLSQNRQKTIGDPSNACSDRPEIWTAPSHVIQMVLYQFSFNTQAVCARSERLRVKCESVFRPEVWS